MKIVILGANGMAGHMITKYLELQGYDVETVAREHAYHECDIEEDKPNFLYMLKPDFIINCIGLLVADSEKYPNRAIYINSWFPHYLEDMFKDTKTKIIHLSTDCVFDGGLGNYLENDVPNEKNIYGRSKAFGELNNTKDITFRTSIIGPELKKDGSGLFNWVVNNPHKTLSGYNNVYWNGMTTLQLAKCIEEYIKNPTVSGIYHLVNNHVNTSKYRLLLEINKIFDLEKKILPVKTEFSNKILYNSSIHNFNIPTYEIQLKELREFIKESVDNYNKNV